MIQTVADFFKRHALTGSGGVLAVSGGPDSVCLARLLYELQQKGTVSKIVLAHLNHQLRGSESDADEAFVADFAKDWNMPLRTKRLDVAAVAQVQGMVAIRVHDPTADYTDSQPGVGGIEPLTHAFGITPASSRDRKVLLQRRRGVLAAPRSWPEQAKR